MIFKRVANWSEYPVLETNEKNVSITGPISTSHWYFAKKARLTSSIFGYSYLQVNKFIDILKNGNRGIELHRLQIQKLSNFH